VQPDCSSNAVIDDLFDMARISRGGLEIKKERAHIAAIIETAIETCRPFFDKRRQSISVDVRQSIFGFVDPTRVSQILGNVLHNAASRCPVWACSLAHNLFEPATCRVATLSAASAVSS
jgi:signal transduction histidine kinase